jgi:hypothetical protein
LRTTLGPRTTTTASSTPSRTARGTGRVSGSGSAATGTKRSGWPFFSGAYTNQPNLVPQVRGLVGGRGDERARGVRERAHGRQVRWRIQAQQEIGARHRDVGQQARDQVPGPHGLVARRHRLLPLRGPVRAATPTATPAEHMCDLAGSRGGFGGSPPDNPRFYPLPPQKSSLTPTSPAPVRASSGGRVRKVLRAGGLPTTRDSTRSRRRRAAADAATRRAPPDNPRARRGSGGGGGGGVDVRGDDERGDDERGDDERGDDERGDDERGDDERGDDDEFGAC